MPKAFTPGLEPTLFHNNHDWRGHHPLEDLLQGTGALATVIASVLFSLWLTRRTPKGDVTRLVLFWLALLGFLSALPQVVIGTVVLQNDVGRAMSYLHFTPIARLFASIGALRRHGCGVLAPDPLSTFGCDRGRLAPRRRGRSSRGTALHACHSAHRCVPDTELHDRSLAAALRGRVDSGGVDSGGGLAPSPHRHRPATILATLLAAHRARLPACSLSAGASTRNRLLLTRHEVQGH